jgi:SAM-dependent methyltransferase
MNTQNIVPETFTFSTAYYENIGPPNPGQDWGKMESYRFNLVCKYVIGDSVLDIGTYFGDFLVKIKKQKPDMTIAGTDINNERVNLSNKNIGDRVVEIGFINGDLTTFKNQSFDTVVCTEVLEHVPNHVRALQELTRVAKKRVIVTVPHAEIIREHICIHCNRLTPANGHLNTYTINKTFENILPKDWYISKQFTFGSIILNMLPSWAPIATVDKILTIFSNYRLFKRRWLFVVLDKK